jgi:hypothetical protein
MNVRSNSLAGGAKGLQGTEMAAPWIGDLYLHLAAAALQETGEIPLDPGVVVCGLVIYSKDLIAAK